MTVLASAADSRYGNWLLNLVGSVKANSDIFDRIVLYDLGLTPFQRRLAGAIRGVELLTVPPFVPHWARGFTWKPWIWTHIDAEELMWLDAGVTVLRPLTGVVEQIRERGYFVVSQGNPLRDIVPSDYYRLYSLPEEVGDREYVAAGIVGFSTSGPFYERVVVPTFDDCLLGRSLGYSRHEAPRLNVGLGATDEVIVRDCARFRWDQSVFNLHIARSLPEAVVNDLDEYAGWQSPRDHARQVIWSHRRRGDFAYLSRVPYRPSLAPLGKAWGFSFRWRWWVRNHSWLFRPGTYLRKARRIITAPFVR